jgi:hypothetical protein
MSGRQLEKAESEMALLFLSPFLITGSDQ